MYGAVLAERVGLPHGYSNSDHADRQPDQNRGVWVSRQQLRMRHIGVDPRLPVQNTRDNLRDLSFRVNVAIWLARGCWGVARAARKNSTIIYATQYIASQILGDLKLSPEKF